MNVLATATHNASYDITFDSLSDDQPAPENNDLGNALSNQKHDNMQLAEILAELGILDRSDLTAVIDIQNGISDSLELLCLVSGIRSRLGEILLKTKCITAHQLEHALELQRNSEKPLGDVLVGLGCLTAQDLNAALIIQSCQQKMSNEGRKLRLGEILVATNEISRHQLQSALEKQKTTGKKLGEVLVEDGYVNADRLERALQAQTLYL